MSTYQNFGPLFNLPVVPVLAEPRVATEQSGREVGGEVRESTDTKLKRPVEQVASGTRGDGQTISDVCKSRHKGNPNSDIAFQSIKDRLTDSEQEVLRVIARAGDYGATCEEIALALNTTQNAISGRCSTLRHIKHKVKKVGTRLTLSGNPASVLVIV